MIGPMRTDKLTPAMLSKMRFGQLVVHRVTQTDDSFTCECRCDCGNYRLADGYLLIYGRTTSCGCEPSPPRGTKLIVGISGSKVYRTWQGMHARCKAKGSAYYANYGGRGIKVCLRWANFTKFLRDMGMPPTADHSIERVNVNGHYEPKNCTWIPRRHQCRNKTTSVHLEHDGRRMIASEWARELGVRPAMILNRKKMGYSDTEILTSPKYGLHSVAKKPEHL